MAWGEQKAMAGWIVRELNETSPRQPAFRGRRGVLVTNSLLEWASAVRGSAIRYDVSNPAAP